MCRYRDDETGLPRPSWDLWEERSGIHAWTVGATWGGLQAAANFAESFGEGGSFEEDYHLTEVAIHFEGSNSGSISAPTGKSSSAAGSGGSAARRRPALPWRAHGFHGE
mgnify:CR=1 FL=1